MNPVPVTSPGAEAEACRCASFKALPRTALSVHFSSGPALRTPSLCVTEPLFSPGTEPDTEPGLSRLNDEHRTSKLTIPGLTCAGQVGETLAILTMSVASECRCGDSDPEVSQDMNGSGLRDSCDEGAVGARWSEGSPQEAALGAQAGLAEAEA